jgi:hypothetical protein
MRRGYSGHCDINSSIEYLAELIIDRDPNIVKISKNDYLTYFNGILNRDEEIRKAWGAVKGAELVVLDSDVLRNVLQNSEGVEKAQQELEKAIVTINQEITEDLIADLLRAKIEGSLHNQRQRGEPNYLFRSIKFLLSLFTNKKSSQEKNYKIQETRTEITEEENIEKRKSELYSKIHFFNRLIYKYKETAANVCTDEEKELLAIYHDFATNEEREKYVESLKKEFYSLSV